jgi:serine/threonine-protein kinase Psk1
MPKDLQTIKNHRFFRKIDWAKLERRELEPPIKPLITDPVLAENFSTDFTGLSLSPPVLINDNGMGRKNEEEDLFGGFSFVASSSLFERERR